MRVRQYPRDVQEAELKSYEHTALALERALWDTPAIETVLGVDGHEVTRSIRQAPPTDTHLSWTRVELGLQDGRVLVIQVNIVPRLPYPRLPHEYRAWLA